MFKKSVLSLLFLSLFIFQGCFENNEVEELNSMVATNEYVLTSTKMEQYIVKKENEGFVLDGANDKILIIDIFATWCPPCKAAATHLTSLQKKYKDDLVIIGVTVEESITNDKLEDFKTEYNADYVLVNSVSNRTLINDVASSLKVGERFPIPLMAMYKNGKLINHYVGAVEEEFIDSDIKKALKK